MFYNDALYKSTFYLLAYLLTCLLSNVYNAVHWGTGVKELT